MLGRCQTGKRFVHVGQIALLIGVILRLEKHIFRRLSIDGNMKLQYENQVKVLLNKQRNAERNARTSRLCRHGAILEGVFPGYRTAETEQTQSGCFVFAGAQGVWGRYFPIASAGRNKKGNLSA